MPDAEARTVCIVTATIMDGPVARWYVHEPAAVAGNEFMSVSRNGILVHTYLDNVPEPVMAAARRALEDLQRDRHAEIRYLATHRRKHLLGDEIEPVSRPAADVDGGGS